MAERDLIINPPEKVLAMYQAVISLLQEGADVNCMKVSDITTYAGIGKGTAYEYFSSKEEIITRALAYDVMQKRNELASIVDGEGSFAEKMERILVYIEEKFGEMQAFCMLVRIGTGSYEVAENLHKEYERIHEDISCNQLEDLMERMARQGVQEGVLRESEVVFRKMAFGAQIVSYAMYLMEAEAGRCDGVSVAQARKFVYESLVRSLS